MASAARPSILRHVCMATPLKRSQPTLNLYVHPIRASAFSSLASKHSPVTSRLAANKFMPCSVPKVTSITSFHTSSKRDILPPLPQRVQGTANDAAPVPEPHPTHGNYHWTFERGVAIALVPVTIAPFVGASMYPVVDATLCALLIIHSHLGFQSCITDYIPDWRMPKTRNAFEWILRIATLVVSVGLYEFETNDVGLTEGIRRIWKA